jgi:TolB-like protein
MKAVVWSELKQRRVVQIAISYLAGGFVVLNVADQLADRGVVPELAYRITLIWYLFGIPAALLIGWYHGEKGKQKAPLSEISLLIMLVVMASGMSFATYSREQQARELAEAAENPLQMTRVAVSYFEDLTDGDFRYLADGLTEDLIVQLSQVQGLSVVSRNGVLQYRDASISADSLARALQVGTIVEGDLERRGSRLRIQLRLVEGSKGNVFRRHSIDLATDQALAARDSVAEATARLLRAWLGEESRVTVTAAATRSTAAWALLQQGEKSFKDANAAIREGRPEDAERLFEEADSLLAQASRADEAWPDPPISRGTVTYRRARLAQRNPQEAVRLVELTVRQADDALQRSSTAARAYELRGTANYYRYLLKVAPDTRTEEVLFASAKADLERAIAFDPLLASAHATLSHLYFTETESTSGVLAAQKAYETDMFLENADLVLWRLFNGTLEQGSFAAARRWCTEGQRRFPDDFRLASCELRLMVTPQVDSPDIDAAWAVLERVDDLAPPNRKESQRVRNEMIVAGVIARVADRGGNPVLRDSARVVLQRATAAVTPTLDPNRETLPIAAYSWLLMGERDRAVQLLQQHAAADPQYYATTRGENSWWWRSLEADPRFRHLIGLN